MDGVRRILEDTKIKPLRKLTERDIAWATLGDRLGEQERGAGWYQIEIKIMDALISVTVHDIEGIIKHLVKFMGQQGYRLVNIHQVTFESCTDGRQFWWIKEDAS